MFYRVDNFHGSLSFSPKNSSSYYPAILISNSNYASTVEQVHKYNKRVCIDEQAT
jgi:hypothetical protein